MCGAKSGARASPPATTLGAKGLRAPDCARRKSCGLQASRPVGRSRRDRRRGKRPPVSRQPSPPKGEPVASLSRGRGRPRPQPCSSYLQENAGSRRASAAVSARPPYRRNGGMSACVFCAERLGAWTAPSATTLGAKGLRAPDCAPAVSAAKTIHSSLFTLHSSLFTFLFLPPSSLIAPHPSLCYSYRDHGRCADRPFLCAACCLNPYPYVL